MSRRNSNSTATRMQAKLNQINARFQELYEQGKYDSALATARLGRKLSKAPEIVHAEAICLYRLGRTQQAYALAKAHPPLRDDSNYYGLMAEVCGALGKSEEARLHGEASLRIRDQEVSGNKVYPIAGPAAPAHTGNSKRIISYTLFGSSPRYCETAILNCKAAKDLLPDWQCRFYCDNSVPINVRERLSQAGGEIILVDEGTRTGIHPLMWRFLVSDDPQVSRFMVRDADSLISKREVAAVNAWVESGKWFHVMRDYYTHCEVMLAGLWGGHAGIIPDMRKEMVDFLSNDHYSKGFIDQYFLRKRVWPTARQSLLSHDSQFNFFNNQPFPIVAGASMKAEDHIGANLSTVAVGGPFEGRDGETVSWTIYDEKNQLVCSYDTKLRNGKWGANIPNNFADRIKSGVWLVRVERKAPDEEGRSSQP